MNDNATVTGSVTALPFPYLGTIPRWPTCDLPPTTAYRFVGPKGCIINDKWLAPLIQTYSNSNKQGETTMEQGKTRFILNHKLYDIMTAQCICFKRREGSYSNNEVHLYKKQKTNEFFLYTKYPSDPTCNHVEECTAEFARNFAAQQLSESDYVEQFGPVTE